MFVLQEKGWSAIFFAAEKADLPMAQLLSEAGASLHLQDKVCSMHIGVY